MNLTEAAGRLVHSYSGGMIRAVEIAQSMLHRPEVLMMDEPTVGLDLRHTKLPHVSAEWLKTGKGPHPSEPALFPQTWIELFLDLRLPRRCRRPITFAETLAASTIPPPDETRSQVIAPAIPANHFL
jgi:hypothetical protein